MNAPTRAAEAELADQLPETTPPALGLTRKIFLRGLVITVVLLAFL